MAAVKELVIRKLGNSTKAHTIRDRVETFCQEVGFALDWIENYMMAGKTPVSLAGRLTNVLPSKYYIRAFQAIVAEAHKDRDLSARSTEELTGYIERFLMEPFSSEKTWEELDRTLDRAAAEAGVDRDELINFLDPAKPFPLDK